MLPKVNFTDTKSYQYLSDHLIDISEKHLKELFAEDPSRFEKLSIEFNDILLDYSKNRITDKTMALLIQLANECGLKEAVNAMFNGEAINETEGRAVLHTALRNQSNAPVVVDGQDIMPDINDVLSKMEQFTDSVISGSWKGYTGKPITDVVNVGIGGSDLGPVMVTEALKAYKNHL